MNKKIIDKDEKLCFALDYMPVEKKYKKQKKYRNLVNIFSIVAAGISLVLGVVSLPVALSVAIVSSIILLPSMYVFNSKMREIIDTVNQSNITFKQFRKMERSGELNKIMQEAKVLQAAPAYVGISKLNNIPSSVKSSNQSSSIQYLNNIRNNDGRNA